MFVWEWERLVTNGFSCLNGNCDAGKKRGGAEMAELGGGNEWTGFHLGEIKVE